MSIASAIRSRPSKSPRATAAEARDRGWCPDSLHPLQIAKTRRHWNQQGLHRVVGTELRFFMHCASSCVESQKDGRMVLSGESLLIILLVGLVAGWLAGKIVTGGGFGIIADIAIGIVGSLIGTW